ncbi:MAG: hypothetical protein HY241_15475 [Actinobacteria bacterium]|nr:hypothetical protein [Actinomycetota bacterium]
MAADAPDQIGDTQMFRAFADGPDPVVAGSRNTGLLVGLALLTVLVLSVAGWLLLR